MSHGAEGYLLAALGEFNLSCSCGIRDCLAIVRLCERCSGSSGRSSAPGGRSRRVEARSVLARAAAARPEFPGYGPLLVRQVGVARDSGQRGVPEIEPTARRE
jgi:hypothetical protein